MGRTRPNSAIRIDGDVAYVTLTRGFEAIIDTTDIPLIGSYHWAVICGKFGHGYAYRYASGGQISMHRFLTGACKGQYVDHADGDGLNNRRSNLRICTQTQNMANRVVDRRNKLGIKGVSQNGAGYSGTITTNGRKVHLGTFRTPEEASAAYRGAARILWGDFAKN